MSNLKYPLRIESADPIKLPLITAFRALNPDTRRVTHITQIDATHYSAKCWGQHYRRHRLYLGEHILNYSEVLQLAQQASKHRE